MKTKRNKIAIILIALCITISVFLLIYTGVVSFLIDGFDYIDNNEEKYIISSTVLTEEIKINLTINESIQIDDINLSIETVEISDTNLSFAILLNNDIHYSYGKLLSQKYPFDHNTQTNAEYSGEIYLECNGQSYKCKRTAIDYGKKNIKYTYSLELDGIHINDNNAEIRIENFCLTQYKKR